MTSPGVRDSWKTYGPGATFLVENVTRRSRSSGSPRSGGSGETVEEEERTERDGSIGGAERKECTRGFQVISARVFRGEVRDEKSSPKRSDTTSDPWFIWSWTGTRSRYRVEDPTSTVPRRILRSDGTDQFPVSSPIPDRSGRRGGGPLRRGGGRR